MKKFITLAIIATLFAGLTTSCIKDLDVIPIDPNLDLPSDILSSEAAYGQVLAQCYAGLSESSSIGVDSDPNISGVDGGYGQYMRALFYLNEIPTDEANCCWNDNTLADIRRNKWASSDIFIMSMFARIYFQISQCNEFIRKAQASQWADSQNMKQWIAEARALRALSYYHAIDMFGNVPFATEQNSVGSVGPEAKTRAEMYEWLVAEIQDFTPGLLKRPDASNYGRCTQMMAKMLLAKLYLNAEVYTGGKTSAWKECAGVCKEIIAEYNPLHNGHVYQIDKIKEKLNPDYIIVALGNNFTQRGETSILDKYDKAKLALELGVDLVLEIPTVFSESSAENFAKAGVTLLNNTKVVTHLCFGAENDDIINLTNVAKVLIDEPKDFKKVLKDELSKGSSFALARNNAINEMFKNNNDVKELINKPNNILAIEYIKALLKLKSKMIPYVIKRNGPGFYETEIKDNISSATNIRQLIHDKKDYSEYVPECVYKILKKNKNVSINDFSDILLYKLNTTTSLELEKIYEVKEGLQNTILSLKDRCDKLELALDSLINTCDLITNESGMASILDNTKMSLNNTLKNVI